MYEIFNCSSSTGNPLGIIQPWIMSVGMFADDRPLPQTTRFQTNAINICCGEIVLRMRLFK